MPALIKFLTPDGLQSAPYSADSLKAAAHYEPEHGIYTVTNTFHKTRVLKLDAHLDRLEDSAHRAGISLTLNRARLRHALREMIESADFGDVRFRITVPADTPETLILTIEPFAPVAPKVIENGVRTLTTAVTSRANPAAKTTDWMHARESLAESMPAGIYDLFLMDSEGHLLEGLSSNFYAVLDGELRTAGEGVLPGIARQVIFEIAPAVIPLRPDAIHQQDIPRLGEAFLTSSSRGIIPVVEIDGQAIGTGTPGHITKALRDIYQTWMANHLQEL